MRVTEPQLRTVLLAQAIEHADAGHTLVSAVELQEATRHAVAAARARSVPRVGVAEVMLDRATTIAQHASGRDSTVAALNPQPGHGERGGLAPWVARGLPLAALLLGLAIDRISNAHRVDLLSPPLLTVLAWNVAAYLLIAWRAGRRSVSSPPGAWLQQALRPLGHPLGDFFGQAGRGRGLSARIAADFHRRWWAHAGDLLQQRTACVLHLCAAAWGAGIALSLLLRGLVVRYQFGWESTFLDAAQVHAIVSVLFAPLTLLTGLTPFTLQEIAATQNFAGESGMGGSRWVGMYVGLLLLAVVLPRLALAAWARWREHRWQGHIDPQGPAFDALRASLPGDLVIGLHGPQGEVQVLLGAGLQTPQGDRLGFAEDPAQPVDAVLAWAASPPPPAWQAAPRLALRWDDFGASWVLEPALFDSLDAALPAHHHALARLRAAWVERNEQRFGQALQALAQHLQACAALHSLAPEAAAAQYAQRVQTLEATLRTLHGAPAAPLQRLAPPADPAQRLPLVRRADSTALAVGTSAGAAAGAAAGAKAGALIDVGTGGLTLGAGTALGALLGGTTAWVVRALQKKDEGRQDLLHHAAEVACTHYLVIAHQQRVPPDEAMQLASRWAAEVTGTVAAHGAALASALKNGAPGDEAVQTLLRTMLMGILQRSFADRAAAHRPTSA
ncbi:DUF2868 domain-containing protein [Acidovorax sp. FHTAMBA]|jgi:hypothetical protein|uniref:DUF3482 domain-containing protein n=1 Tax=Acidovorax sp. FHTAMBA TaxID=3140252 RepID=UPI0015F43074